MRGGLTLILLGWRKMVTYNLHLYGLSHPNLPHTFFQSPWFLHLVHFYNGFYFSQKVHLSKDAIMIF